MAEGGEEGAPKKKKRKVIGQSICGAPTKEGRPCWRPVYGDRHRYCSAHRDPEVRRARTMEVEERRERLIQEADEKKKRLRERLDPGPLDP